MNALVKYLLLPLRAPMLLVLLAISVYLGLHWSRPSTAGDTNLSSFTTLVWSAECLQALLIVVVCTVPDLLLRRVASMMAGSRVLSLVMTLLIVITGGMYLLHLDVLTNVLILSSAVLLARLDLVRLRVVSAPFVMTLFLSVLVLGGVNLGRTLEVQLRPHLPASPAIAAPRRPAPAAESSATGAAEPEAGAEAGQRRLPNRALRRNRINAAQSEHAPSLITTPSAPQQSGATER